MISDDLKNFCNGYDFDNVAPPQMPHIGDLAPEFNAITTNGAIKFPSDYAGKWVVLFSHPSDFTPVCTSEFIALQHAMADFNKLNTMLLGLSIGSIPSHLAWIRAIKEIDGTDITFPVIADADATIANRYGMVSAASSDTNAVRAVFIIDPRAIVRAIIYYPPVLGRNIEEIKRVIMALQTADAFKVAMPANWNRGDDVLMPTPSSAAALRKVNTNAWFYRYKKLSRKDIDARLYTKKTGKK